MFVAALAASVAALLIVAPHRSDATVPASPARCDEAAASGPAAAVMAKACQHAVEDVSARSERGRVFENPDGTSTMRLSAVPERIRRPDGTWAAIDVTLRRDGDGWVPVTSAAAVRFSDGGSGPFATLIEGHRSFTMSWPGRLSKPTVAGDTVTYPDVYPGVDLTVRATIAGFTHVLVVKDATAAANPALRRIEYRLGGTGVSVSRSGSGGLVVTGDDGGVMLASGAAAMWDSTAGAELAAPDRSSARAPGEAARQSEARVDLVGDRLILAPDQQFLSAAVPPLYLDPAFIAPAASRWAYATNTNETWEPNWVRVGLNPENGWLYRAFFEFPTSSGGRSLHQSQVTSATFSIQLFHSFSCQNTPTPVFLYKTGAIATTPRTDWSPALTDFMDAQSASANKQDCYTPATPTMSFGGDLTGMMQSAASNNWPAITFGLSTRDANGGGESTQNRWKRFTPNTAQLTVHFNHPPDAPSLAHMSMDPGLACSPAPLAVNAASDLTLRAQLSDLDAGDNVKAQWQVSGIPAEYAPPDSGFAAPGSFTTRIPAAAFTNGGSYSWRVRGSDGTHQGAYGPWCPFTVDNSLPASPAVTSTDLALSTGLIVPPPPSSAVVGRPATVTLRPAPGDINIVGYLIGVRAGVAAEATIWVPANPDGSVAVPVVPVTHGGVNFLTIRARKLTGQTGPPSTYRFAANSAPNGARVPADATGDGRADLTHLAEYNGVNRLWRWTGRTTGAGLTAPVAPQDLITTFPGGSRGVSGDFDGDGLSDVAVLQQSPGQPVLLSVQRSDRNSLLGTQVLTFDASWSLSRMTPLASNVDADAGGRDDLVILYDDGGSTVSLRVLLATGSPGTVGFAAPVNWLSDPGAVATSIRSATGDFDGDGRGDVAVVYRYTGCQTRMWIHYSTGSAFLDGKVVWESAAGQWCWERTDPVAGDFDGDGRSDVAMFYHVPGCETDLYAFYGTASRTVDVPTAAAWRSGPHRLCGPGLRATAMDVDGDGRADLSGVYSCCGAYQVKVLTFGSGGRSFAAPRLDWEGGIGPAGTGTVSIDTAARYQIVNLGSSKCLAVNGGDGTQVTLQPCTAAPNQTYTIDRATYGPVRIHPVQAPNSCLDVRNGSSTTGTPIQQVGCHPVTSNLFQYQLFTPNYVRGWTEPVLNIAVYINGLAFDLPSYNDGAGLHQWSAHGDLNQLFLLRRVS